MDYLFKLNINIIYIMSFANVYIDQIYIENVREANGDNFATNQGDIISYPGTTGGYNWVVQLVNKGGSTHNFTANDKIVFDVFYPDSTSTASATFEIALSGSIIGNNGNYYVYSNVAGLDDPPSNILPTGLSGSSLANNFLLADFYDTSGGETTISAATKITLNNSTTTTDVGANVITNVPFPGILVIANSTLADNIDPNNNTSSTYSIWRRDVNNGPTSSFSNSNWASVYTSSNTADGSRLNASISGDPHVTTVYGITYKFDYLGAFRLYEDDNIIINGLSERGDKKRWSSRQYVRKIFIQSKNKEILIDLGFRGSKAKVLENNGFEVTEEELEFSNEAKVHSWDCKKEFAIHDLEGIKEHRKNHKILDPVRNKLNINIEGYKIFVENINEFNLQPCRLFFDRIDSNYTNAVGCVIDRKYVGVSLLDDIKNTESVKNIKENLELVYKYTELEIEPEKINIKYV